MRKVSPLSRDEADVYGRRSPRLLPRTIVRSGSEDRGDEKSSREMESWPPDHVGWGTNSARSTPNANRSQAHSLASASYWNEP